MPDSAPPAVPYLTWRIARTMLRHPRLFIRLGNLETALYEEQLATIAIDRPVFICGLARSGTTILLETLAGLPGFASHHYRDFPGVHLPLLWHRAMGGARRPEAPAVERLHGDGIMISEDSPEALDEAIWTSFFPQLHDPTASNRLEATMENPAFERFYADHLKKILLLRHGRRLVLKGNYLVARLGYLVRLFPDAIILLTYRDPVEHVASLMRQQANFAAATRRDPHALDYLQALGHFEFGEDRRPINLGPPGALAPILDAWSAGSESEGWALYWHHIYDRIADQLTGDAGLRRRVRLIPFEGLAGRPADCLAEILSACGVAAARPEIERLAGRFHVPAPRRGALREDQSARIEMICAPVAARIEALRLAQH